MPAPPPATPPRKRRLRNFLLVGTLVLILLPFGLMYAMSFLFSKHDRIMLPYESKFLTDSFGHTIHYYELIQPDAQWNIVFVHGTPGSAAAFREQFHDPFPRANLVALDRPGFGGSTPALRHPSLDDQAEALGSLLLLWTNHPVILVGHSYGGPVIVQTALKYPDRVAGLLLIGGSVDPGQEHPYIIQYVGSWPLFSWLLPRPLRQCNRELLALKGDLIRLRERLPSLSVPVVMLHGDKDPLVPVANVDYLRGELARAGKTNLFQPLVFPDYNHFIPWKHPEAVAEAIGLVTNAVTRLSSKP